MSYVGQYILHTSDTGHSVPDFSNVEFLTIDEDFRRGISGLSEKGLLLYWEKKIIFDNAMAVAKRQIGIFMGEEYEMDKSLWICIYACYHDS